jgi:hypothetical protein
MLTVLDMLVCLSPLMGISLFLGHLGYRIDQLLPLNNIEFTLGGGSSKAPRNAYTNEC